MVQQSTDCCFISIPSSVFMSSFWCAALQVSVLEIIWFCYPDVLLHYVCGRPWSPLNFHVVLKTSFLRTRALFRVLCSGVSMSLFGLRVKQAETVLQLVVLVAAIVVGPRCVRLVRSVILVVTFSRAWMRLSISNDYLWLFPVICTIHGTCCYRYR